jgi:hypothetical protein
MDDDHNLRDEFNRQFELRTGLKKRDKAKYWNTRESQTETWEECAAQMRKRPRTLILAVGAMTVSIVVATVWRIAASSSKTQLSQNQPGIGHGRPNPFG